MGLFKLRKKMQDHDIDLAIITDDDSLYYFTGYYNFLHMDFFRPTILLVPKDDESTLINGVKEFLKWCKNQNILMAVCTNKTEYLAIDLLKKIGIYDFFDYVSGFNTFEYCKPDPRHLLKTIEIIDGDKNKSIMVGDSETDANAAEAAKIPMILLKYGYTEKRSEEIYHNYLIKDFIGIEKIISKYL